MCVHIMNVYRVDTRLFRMYIYLQHVIDFTFVFGYYEMTIKTVCVDTYSLGSFHFSLFS